MWLSSTISSPTSHALQRSHTLFWTSSWDNSFEIVTVNSNLPDPFALKLVLRLRNATDCRALTTRSAGAICPTRPGTAQFRCQLLQVVCSFAMYTDHPLARRDVLNVGVRTYEASKPFQSLRGRHVRCCADGCEDLQRENAGCWTPVAGRRWDWCSGVLVARVLTSTMATRLRSNMQDRRIVNSDRGRSCESGLRFTLVWA